MINDKVNKIKVNDTQEKRRMLSVISKTLFVMLIRHCEGAVIMIVVVVIHYIPRGLFR